MTDSTGDPKPDSSITDANPDANPDDASAAVSAAPPATHPTVADPTPAPVLDTGYTESGVPTFEGVREKIETRYGTALGATELAEETPEVRSADQRYAATQKAAADKLEEIRASMRKPEADR